jgi:hypothetical protein
MMIRRPNRLPSVHGNLIRECLRNLAEAYLEPLSKEALKRGFAYSSLTPEGRRAGTMWRYLRRQMMRGRIW